MCVQDRGEHCKAGRPRCSRRSSGRPEEEGQGWGRPPGAERGRLLPQLNAPLSGSLISISLRDEWNQLMASVGAAWPPRREGAGRGGSGPFPTPAPQPRAAVTSSSLHPTLAGVGRCWAFQVRGVSPFGEGGLCTSRLLQQRAPQSSRWRSTCPLTPPTWPGSLRAQPTSHQWRVCPWAPGSSSEPPAGTCPWGPQGMEQLPEIPPQPVPQSTAPAPTDLALHSPCGPQRAQGHPQHTLCAQPLHTLPTRGPGSDALPEGSWGSPLGRVASARPAA